MKELKCPKCGATFTVDESDYNEIVKQVKDAEFKAEMDAREKLIKAQMMADANREKTELDNKRQQEIANLKSDIIKLDGLLKSKDSENKLAIRDALSEKEAKILELQGQLDLKKKDAELEMKNLKESYEGKLKEKDEQVAYYKDLKTRMSTKLVGETLEQHCQIEFNKQRTVSYPNAYFEKDNDAKTGSKGDYIFRDYIDGVEVLSIMFEMKNESDTTSTKHKNEDFFKELDKDRQEKGCEYAVLVSMLEADSEYYNAGIVDVSYRYPKMFVVRPQNFMAIIGLLKNAALNAAQYKKELAIAKNQNLDYSNFEAELENFKNGFNTNFNAAKNHFANVIKDIDTSIEKLKKVKESLESTERQLRLANDKAQAITVKKLTKNSPSVREAIENANKNQEN